MLNYYPSHPSIPRINKLLKHIHDERENPGRLIQLDDEAEIRRLQDVEALKARGKGKPKKVKKKGPYKSFHPMFPHRFS
jgi:Mitochondrial ribosomal subunit S27